MIGSVGLGLGKQCMVLPTTACKFGNKRVIYNRISYFSTYFFKEKKHSILRQSSEIDLDDEIVQNVPGLKAALNEAEEQYTRIHAKTDGSLPNYIGGRKGMFRMPMKIPQLTKDDVPVIKVSYI